MAAGKSEKNKLGRSEAVAACAAAGREVLRSGFAGFGKILSDQKRGLPRPTAQKPCSPDATMIALPQPEKTTLQKANLFDCIGGRQSRRKFTDQPITMAELSYLLWATQGVRRVLKDGTTFRTVPSGGSIHPFDTYLAIKHIEGVPPGIYLYQPIDHALVFLDPLENREQIIAEETIGPSPFAVVFIWVAVPYRTEWRYVTESAKLILLDAGHVCQNLYLACESIGCGTCAIGAYDQDKIDKLLKLDGNNELVVYLAPVGKI